MTSNAELRVIPAPKATYEALVSAGATDNTPISVDEIRAELRRIVGSSQFDASKRNRRFLEYVVEEKLDGRAERIKAYTIATMVFGRDVDFDPQQDPIVRIEAGRLRRSLERFYLTEGKHSSIRIGMPKGGYVPEFGGAPTGTAHGQGTAPGITAPDGYLSSILVMPFDVEVEGETGGAQPMLLNCEQRFTRRLMIGLSRYPHIRVFGSTSHCPRIGARGNGAEPAGCSADFVLTGSSTVVAGTLHVKAVLLEVGTNWVLWGQTFEREVQSAGILGACDDVANAMIRTLAQPFGILLSHRARTAAWKDPRIRTVSETIILFHQYRRSYRRPLFQPAREALQRAIASDPDCAEAFSCLSQLCTDGHRFRFAPGEPPAELRKQALALAYKSIELAPDSSCGYHALGLAFWSQGEWEASLQATQTALALNTNAFEIVADLALHWSLLAEWGRALPLLENASTMNRGYSSAHHAGLSLYHFIHGRFTQALAAAKEIRSPDVTHGYAVQAAALARLGRRKEASEAIGFILEIDPHYGPDVLTDVSGGNLSPDLADRFREALFDAGLSAAAAHGRVANAAQRRG